MASKRMFLKSFIESDFFTDLTHTAQILYIHLCMQADDDGFINSPKKIMRSILCCENDLKLLAEKGFIIMFRTGIVAIRHWKLHNTIQKDRYKTTIYLQEKDSLVVEENGMYNVASSLDTNYIQVESVEEENYIVDVKKTDSVPKVETKNTNYNEILTLYTNICVSFPKIRTLSEARKKAIKARLNTFTIEDFKTVFTNAENSDFLKGKNNRNWSATFDWLMKDTNFLKVLEGNYNNKDVRTQPKTKTAEQLDGFYHMATDWATEERNG